MAILPIYNTEGKEVDQIKLDSSVFDETINEAVVHQAIIAYRSNQRKGLAKTKTRGEVSGGGRKPYRQKGTGRSRAGSIRSPLWRHGGVTFGSGGRDFSYKLPRKIKLSALKSTLNAKIKEGNLLVLDKFVIEKPKTKEAMEILSKLKIVSGKKQKYPATLLLLDKIDINLRLALGNINFLDVNRAQDTYPYEVLTHQKVLITKEGLDRLTARMKK